MPLQARYDVAQLHPVAANLQLLVTSPNVSQLTVRAEANEISGFVGADLPE